MSNKWKKLRKKSLGEIPQEASANLQAPEIAPSRSTNKINNRTKPLNFKVSEEFSLKRKKFNGGVIREKFGVL